MAEILTFTRNIEGFPCQIEIQEFENPKHFRFSTIVFDLYNSDYHSRESFDSLDSALVAAEAQCIKQIKENVSVEGIFAHRGG